MEGTVTSARTITAVGALAVGALGAADLLHGGNVGEAVALVTVSVMAFVGILAAPGEVLTRRATHTVRRVGERLRMERAAVSSATGAAALGLAGLGIAWGGRPWGGGVLTGLAVVLGGLAVHAARPRRPRLRLIRGEAGTD